MDAETPQLTVTREGKSSRAIGKGKNLPWEMFEPRGKEKSAAGIVPREHGKEPQIFKPKNSCQATG